MQVISFWDQHQAEVMLCSMRRDDVVRLNASERARDLRDGTRRLGMRKLWCGAADEDNRHCCACSASIQDYEIRYKVMHDLAYKHVPNVSLTCKKLAQA